MIDPDEALGREWLETNGLGGYASSTVAGLNSRRYHGLLVAALDPPINRFVVLSKIEETLVVGSRRYDLSANQYPGVMHPRGHRFLSGVAFDPFPVFRYDIDGVRLEKSIWMVQGENTTVVEYSIADLTDADAHLELRPLIAFRDFHALTHENDALDRRVRTGDGIASVTPYQGLPSLHLAHDADDVVPQGFWFRRFEYHVERARGLDFTEDLFNPLTLIYRLRGRHRVRVVASTDREQSSAGLKACATPLQNVAQGLSPALQIAAQQFIVSRGDGHTVIAGYHWFSDWGRDTMIALPGLALATGRFDLARTILAEFARHVDRGMIPNRFPDTGGPPEYNSVDATLWFVEAVRAFTEATSDHAFVRARLYPILLDILSWHERGTRFGIRLDDDGLLLAGDEGTQLTWMDAMCGGRPVTPRHGKPVEIQALWYNALRGVGALAAHYRDTQTVAHLREMATRAKKAFAGLFWNKANRGLFDVVRGNERDASIRPNQLVAVSLPFSMITPHQRRDVVALVERELLTPFGLRTLARGDPRYRGRYDGDIAAREAVYHQGAVWPWLIGPFIHAYLRVHRGRTAARRQADAWLQPLREYQNSAGPGRIPELFDGDPPHAPRGCISQAWSVAAVLSAIGEIGVLPASAPRNKLGAE